MQSYYKWEGFDMVRQLWRGGNSRQPVESLCLQSCLPFLRAARGCQVYEMASCQPSRWRSATMQCTVLYYWPMKIVTSTIKDDDAGRIYLTRIHHKPWLSDAFSTPPLPQKHAISCAANRHDSCRLQRLPHLAIRQADKHGRRVVTSHRHATDGTVWLIV